MAVTRVGIEIDESLIGTTSSVGNYEFSGDGKKIVFSLSGNCYVYDIDLKELTDIIHPMNEFAPAYGCGSFLSIDYDGNRILFGSRAPNLVPNDENGDEVSFFVYDITTSTTKLVSVDSDGDQTWANSHADITADGKFVIIPDNVH